MSLSKKIAAALDENTRAYVLPCTVTVEGGPGRLVLHLTALDSVGLACSALEFAASSRSELSPEVLKAWGERLASRVTYLMEPLKVVELDAQGGEIQMRSQSPTPRDEKRSYYEIQLSRQGTLRMARYAFDEATRTRGQVPCQLTRETLERLADDLAQSVP
jgi:hypothetical protein